MSPTTPGTSGFVPPPYPYERLDALKQVADSLPGGVVDCSIGTPCDAVPDVAARAADAAVADAMGYPTSAGAPAFRDAAAAWITARFDSPIDATNVAACVGTKEFVASLPQLLKLRDPSRDTVLYPSVAYPTYEMGATLAGCRAVAVPLDSSWHLDVGAITKADADRALLLWVNEPGNPTSSVATSKYLQSVAEWGRQHGVIVASDECYVEYAPEPASILESGLDGVLALHSLSKRSNLAGMRVGFYAGDEDLVSYLVETRKHAGLMVPSPMQAAAIAALADERHVDDQRARYAERRAFTRDALAHRGLVHDGGSCLFYLWMRDEDDARSGRDGWAIATELAQDGGLLVSPGDLYGPAGADHVRIALVQPRERLALAFDRMARAGA